MKEISRQKKSIIDEIENMIDYEESKGDIERVLHFKVSMKFVRRGKKVTAERKVE